MFASPNVWGWIGIYAIFGLAQLLACMVFGHRYRKAGWYFHFFVMWLGTPTLLTTLYGWDTKVVSYNTMGVTIFVMIITLLAELKFKPGLWFQTPSPKAPSRDRRKRLKYPSRHLQVVDKRADDPLACLSTGLPLPQGSKVNITV